MNFRCHICEQFADEVCIHPNCAYPPFVCSGPCTNQATSMIHNHDQEPKYISMI
jgi:hypothetical protein